jgi:hypothetical protein
MIKRKKELTMTILVFLLFVILSSNLLAYPTGITGRTRKTTTTGCGGGCHSNNTSITCVITGPDTVTKGQSATFTIAITRTGSNAGAGCNIAVRLGTLVPGTGMQLMNGELTHTSAWTLSGGTVSRTFTYTAPAAAGTDTIWSNGAVGYSNGFNWGAEKRIIVRNPTAIVKLSEGVPVNFSLEQNYPNPFNPTTKIKFNVPEYAYTTLSISDITGKIVTNAVNENLTPGIYEYEFSASALSSGIYFYTLKSKDINITKKMIVSK